MKWINRIKLLQISKFLIIVCLILSIVLAGFTIYGDKVGNFVISTQEQDPGIKIAITQYEDLSHQTDILAIKGLTEQTNTTLERIPFDVSYGLGDKSDVKFKRYLAYSFYLVNNSATTVDLTAVIQITEMSNHLDSAVRVMLIMGDESRGEVFAKEQEDADYKPLGIAEDSPY